jgi:hypothetical protein
MPMSGNWNCPEFPDFAASTRDGVPHRIESCEPARTAGDVIEVL